MTELTRFMVLIASSARLDSAHPQELARALQKAANAVQSDEMVVVAEGWTALLERRLPAEGWTLSQACYYARTWLQPLLGHYEPSVDAAVRAAYNELEELDDMDFATQVACLMHSGM